MQSFFFYSCTSEDPVPVGTWKLGKAVFTVLLADTLVNEGIFYDSVFTESFVFIDLDQVHLDLPIMLPDGEELVYNVLSLPTPDGTFMPPIERLNIDMMPDFLYKYDCTDSEVTSFPLLIEKHIFKITNQKLYTMYLLEDVVYNLRIKYPNPPSCFPPLNGRIVSNPHLVNVRIEYWLSQ